MRQADQGCGIIDSLGKFLIDSLMRCIVKVDQLDLDVGIGKLRDALEDIQIGWKVRSIGDDLGPIASLPHQPPSELEQIDRGRIANDRFPRLGPDDQSDFCLRVFARASFRRGKPRQGPG